MPHLVKIRLPQFFPCYCATALNCLVKIEPWMRLWMVCLKFSGLLNLRLVGGALNELFGNEVVNKHFVVAVFVLHNQVAHAIQKLTNRVNHAATECAGACNSAGNVLPCCNDGKIQHAVIFIVKDADCGLCVLQLKPQSLHELGLKGHQINLPIIADGLECFGLDRI